MASPTPPDRVLPEDVKHRPVERFWPYAELSEEPPVEELAQLHPELREVLFGAPTLPFSISIVFPEFEGESRDLAVERARASDEYATFETQGVQVHRARFYPGSRPNDLRDLYALVAGVTGSEVLVDDRAVPYARELWLPLVWFLIR